ncbi:MAG: ABC-F family ATP-binding cassette domain-containing protein [Candidatus Susulua stagnicola]|nr:ABC-F family ATP-binding cassette domain-containing protein [Candidatus Susulua stagnicola]
MITLNNLSKSYGARTLFEGINLTLNRGIKSGLVGPNGAGKSTLFSIILGLEESTSGSVQIKKNIHIGYLPQEAAFKSKTSVLSEAVKGDTAIKNLVKEKKQMEDQGKAGSEHYGDILHNLEFRGYFELEHKAKKILTGLGFTEKTLKQPVSELSGGWQMRVLLARLLTCHYDILLLDEPMNHLDLSAAIWFKDYLLSFSGTFIMISHDKDFLDQVTNHILVLENQVITKIKGNYKNYQKIQDEKATHLLKQSTEQEKKRKQLQQFIYRFHGQPNKASQVRAKKRIIEKMKGINVPMRRRESIRNFTFPTTTKSGHQVVNLEKIFKSYGDIEVYKNFYFEIIQGEKAVLVGENGAGKSTLLKILAGAIDTDSGKRTLGHNVSIGYFSQRRMEVLDSNNTVFEEVYRSASGDNTATDRIRTILSLFLFTGDDIEKKVTVLSGGEKSRLILAKLLINPPNLLLLDEPTTHLDIDAIEALVRALKAYQGTLVFISHDIHFVRSIANTVFDVKSGRVRKFPGNFDYYWEKIKSGDLDKPINSSKNKSKFKLSKSKNKKKPIPEKVVINLKKHNFKTAKAIKTLRKEKEKLELEDYSKTRSLSNRQNFHNDQTSQVYHKRLTEIKTRLKEIGEEIIKLKSSFIQ